MGVDAEFGLHVFPACAHQFRRRFHRFLIMAVKADGGFQHQKNVETFILDLAITWAICSDSESR